MARKRSTRSQGGSSSPNKVLVVFLVLFILATLGLGGWVYSIFGERHKWEKSAKDAKINQTAADKARDWALLQAYELRNMLGDPSIQDEKATLEWKNLRDEFVAEADTPDKTKIKEGSKFDGEKDKDAFFELVKNGRKYLGWNGQTHRYTSTYQGKITERDKFALEQRTAHYAELKKEFAQEQKVRSLAKDYETHRAEQLAKIDAGNAAALKASTERTQAMTEQIAKNEEQRLQLDTLDKQYKADKAMWTAKFAAQEAELRKVGTSMPVQKEKEKEGKVAKGQPVVITQAHALLLDISKGKPLWDRARGKIVRIDEAERRVYIDKGARDGVKTGLTFNVFGAGWEGRAEGPFKGTIEVVRVEPATSVARITSLYDAQGNEISLNDLSPSKIIRGGNNAWKDGDLIFNLVWGAHVAVAGVVDWSGRGAEAPAAQQDELQEFLHAVESQGVTVDAYVDLRDGQIRGQMTPKTAYLIVGYKAYAGPKGADAARVKAANDAFDSLRKAANDRGMFQISPDNFLNVVGYRRPRSKTDTELSLFHPGMPAGGYALTLASGEGKVGGPVTELSGRWSGKLAGGGQLRLTFKGDGGCIWQMVVGMDTLNGFTNIGRTGNDFTATIQNRPATLRLVGGGQALLVTGQGMEATLTKE
jgi:hypothetical protein